MIAIDDKTRLNEMALNAQTGHLKTSDANIYELGKALERALEEIDDRRECQRCDLCVNHDDNQ